MIVQYPLKANANIASEEAIFTDDISIYYTFGMKLKNLTPSSNNNKNIIFKIN